MKTLTFFKKNNASKKRSIKIFFNEILRLKPTNNKKQVVKQNADEFKKLKMKLRLMVMMMMMMMRMMMMETLLNTWKKGQNLLEAFWRL